MFPSEVARGTDEAMGSVKEIGSLESVGRPGVR
jgi:hypothetical protein